MKLKKAARAGDTEAFKAIMLEYLDWEIKPVKGKEGCCQLASWRFAWGCFLAP